MKLICEERMEDIQYLAEEKDGKKTLFIEGIFMQSNLKNKNGRLYPTAVMEKEVSRYIKEEVERRTAYGELNHPSGPAINLDRVSHIIESLRWDGANVIGKARVLDTLCGNTVRGLIEGGCNVGVSSRGLGTLRERNGIMEVQDDYKICTAADIVAHPSAPDAFVKGIMEGVEFFYNDAGNLVEKAEQAKAVMKKMSSRELQEKKLRLFENFLKQLNS
jgi:hypothetical protein